jgi:rubrerythrin
MRELVNIDEVFAMAIQIESNAAAFYRGAAKLQSAAQAISLLLDLADMEDGHKKVFARMRENAVAKGRLAEPRDLNLEGGLFLSAIAGGFRVEGSRPAAESLTALTPLPEILRLAIDLEKQSVLFYLGIVDVLTEDAELTEIGRIIGEEKTHVVALMTKLRALERGPGAG